MSSGGRSSTSTGRRDSQLGTIFDKHKGNKILNSIFRPTLGGELTRALEVMNGKASWYFWNSLNSFGEFCSVLSPTYEGGRRRASRWPAPWTSPSSPLTHTYARSPLTSCSTG